MTAIDYAAPITKSAVAKRNPAIRDFSLIIALAAIWIFFAIRAPAFLGARNLSMLVIDLSVTAILALGMLLVLLPGHIDLSCGSGVGLCGAVAAVLVFWHRWPAPAAMAVALSVALLLWMAMGALVVKQRMPAFIITLCGLLIFRGLHWKIIQGQTVPVVAGGGRNLYALLTTYYLPPAVGWALAAIVIVGLTWARLGARKRRQAHGLPVDDGETTFLKLLIAAQIVVIFVLVTNQFAGVPLPAVILGATALVIHILTQNTPFGRYLYAIGGNEEAAVLSGVPVQKVVIAAFAIMGAIVALTGFMQTAYAGATTSNVGELMELNAVAACVIGGTSLRGGRGTVLGVLFGSLIMASLLNGMTLMAVSPEMKYIARGVVLGLAVWLDVKLAGGK
jgi:D-xylose transport system permease protein